jgi:hypothetical protein
MKIGGRGSQSLVAKLETVLVAALLLASTSAFANDYRLDFGVTAALASEYGASSLPSFDEGGASARENPRNIRILSHRFVSR